MENRRSFQTTLALAVLVAGAWPLWPESRPVRFTASDAVRAEWERRLPPLGEAALARLSREDAARWERARRRIGAPGTPDLLPPELAAPTAETWEGKAREARSPQERFTALHFLNRLKSPKALDALAGLGRADARNWPRLLRLENPIATARLNGAEVSAGLAEFLDGLREGGKVDPVRAQAARLRLVMAGKEKELLPLVKGSPGSVLALLDAWNRGPWESRKTAHQTLLTTTFGNRFICAMPGASPAWAQLGLDPRDLSTGPWSDGALGRLFEGLPQEAPPEALTFFPRDGWNTLTRPTQATLLGCLRKFGGAQGTARGFLTAQPAHVRGLALGTARKLGLDALEEVREELLRGPDGLARGFAIEDLPTAPADLEALAHRSFKDSDLDSIQALVQAFDRWKLPAGRQQALLAPFLQHPDWGWRHQAYLQLRKLDSATPWPVAPAPLHEGAALLKLAQRLAIAGKPVRLRITFTGPRAVTLKLDPKVAPLNVANLVRLARRKFFDGRLVPRVVPDFVVQMGSPIDTMDGGPGYTVRCENSLDWYGPGSVGMALSGKDTGGSQFFITTNATPHLTGRYTRMGEVEDPERALKVLDDLELGAKILSVRVIP